MTKHNPRRLSTSTSQVQRGATGRRCASLMFASFVGFAACGGAVRAVDPRDPSLPTQTRQWLAAAQDGVIAAKARRDAAQFKLNEVRAWANRVDDEVDFDGGPGSQLDDLAESRLDLAEAELQIAEREVRFAEAKLDLAYAERAVHHDLGSYDLKPLREAVQAAREDVASATRSLVQLRTQTLEANRNWWAAYAQFAQGGGDTRSFWIGEREPIEQVETSSPRENSPADDEVEEAPGPIAPEGFETPTDADDSEESAASNDE